MFTGHIDQLPDKNYLSSALLGYMKMAFEAIQADTSLGTNTLIDGVLSYTIVANKNTPAQGKPAEIHQQYIDVHLVLSGQEQIGYSNLPLIIDDESKAAKDLYFGPLEQENYVRLAPGEFAIFFPGEVHKPMSDYQGENLDVVKAIIKLRYDQI